jgi:hypothetical protein
LGKFIIPQTYYFAQFVSECAKNYISNKKVVVSENGSIIFYINVESIKKMLSLPQNHNSKTWNQLNALGDNDRTSLLMDATKVLTKKILVQQPQNKSNSIQRSIETFMKRYKELVKMGLPPCWDKNGNFIQYKSYKDMLIKARDDITQFQYMDGVLKCQTIFCKLIDGFHLLWKIKNLFPNIPSYDRYTVHDIAS